MRALSGLSFVLYDMCNNSCMLFAGKYASLSRCTYCRHPRFRSNKKPFKQFHYLPFIPQVQALYSNTISAKTMRYRHDHHDDNTFREDGRISDVYDSVLYRNLRRSEWENVICIGLIPGPRKPKNFNSFMWVYSEELKHAARGVSTYDAEEDALFPLHIYAPLGSGDMPAVASAFSCTKNHNAKRPCRFCPIEAVPIKTQVRKKKKNPIHYVPMTRPPNYAPNSLDPGNLPTISHAEFVHRAKLVDHAPTVSDRNELSQLYGINTTPILASVPGVSFPYSFPFDFMHLLENLLKNYVKLISGDFKGLKGGRETYILPNKVWKEIGAATVAANATIPASFGRRIPNIAEDRTYFTAEAYLVWFTLYAPIILRNRFSRPKYYNHFMLLVGIINRCLAIVTTREERAALRRDILAWYAEYEQIFYQFTASRLPACLITVHAWLHVVDLIEQSGPLWGYWCWVMERYCSRLLRAVSSRKYPYASLNRRILETQSLLAIRNSFNLQDALPRYTVAHQSRTQESWEDEEKSQYSDLKLVGPSRILRLDEDKLDSLKKRIAVHIMTRNGVANRSLVLSSLPQKILQWSKIQIKDGDIVSSLHGDNRQEENQRTANFCQYELLVDALARNHDVAPVLDGKTFFGEVERIFLMQLSRNPKLNQPKDEIIILLDIHSCITHTEAHGFFEYERYGSREVVDGSALRAVVGRIRQGAGWTFVRRPGVFEHATYAYEDEDTLSDD
ncbi:hypothetical protein M407DRAFT_71182 [Tulasnella calospora MUT 4182]|uniref:Transposase domain-containing protein n=1 Tax=Tulasnella calospora MUT 4182 TaxID=1051891 RepID=A0A0C3QMC8_9AGAM|nr:hypothetical protein M407DRAFT_71182 [Tulasnella calospora MUT 4182]